MTSIGASVLAPTETGIPRRTVSVLVGVAVCAPALPVFFGMGFWTMSATIAINGALVATAIYHAARGGSLQEFWRQGSYASSSGRFLLLNLINAAEGALPALIIGRFFGVAALGLFDRAFALIVTPVGRAAAAVESVLFSHHADLHRTGKTQTNVFLRSLSIAFLVGIPFAVGVVENGPLIVDVALGAKWGGVVSLVAPLAALAVLTLALQVAVAVLNGRGRPEVDLLAQLVSILVFLVSVAFLAVDDTADILWVLVATLAFRVLCLVAAVGYLLAIRLQSLLLCIVPGGLTAIIALTVNRTFPENLAQSISEPARLVIIMGIYALILLLTWFAHQVSFFARLFGGSPKGRIADDARGGSSKDL
jgi:O-antigen/teichoic acid export membrane protein